MKALRFFLYLIIAIEVAMILGNVRLVMPHVQDQTPVRLVWRIEMSDRMGDTSPYNRIGAMAFLVSEEGMYCFGTPGNPCSFAAGYLVRDGQVWKIVSSDGSTNWTEYWVVGGQFINCLPFPGWDGICR